MFKPEADNPFLKQQMPSATAPIDEILAYDSERLEDLIGGLSRRRARGESSWSSIFEARFAHHLNTALDADLRSRIMNGVADYS